MNIFMFNFFSSAFGDAEAEAEPELVDDDGAGVWFPEQPATTTLDMKTAETIVEIAFFLLIKRHAPF
ncbi:hypothetical protein [Paenibacillus sp. MBLB4367]|uniref:hypothetical protein n=1 Tax=Paenibacillus sp. MBLB4367 TaxID=3384767 RepID=UPI003908309C